MSVWVCSPTQSHRSRAGHLHGKRPVRSGQRANHVGAAGCQDVVDGVGRSNDAFASRRRGASGEPADNVAGFLIVEGPESKLASHVASLRADADATIWGRRDLQWEM